MQPSSNHLILDPVSDKYFANIKSNIFCMTKTDIITKILNKEAGNNIQNFFSGLFPVLPLPCLNGCHCYCSADDEANTVNCSFNNMTQLPNFVPPRTEQLVMTGNNLNRMDFPNQNLSTIKMLDLDNNSIRSFDEESLEALLLSNISVKLSDNKIRQIPQILGTTDLHGKIWLAGNPYECNCDMMWMRDWLQNATNVMDRDHITCGPGRYEGKMTQVFFCGNSVVRTSVVLVFVCVL